MGAYFDFFYTIVIVLHLTCIMYHLTCKVRIKIIIKTGKRLQI
jgi:hypothetical protein